MRIEWLGVIVTRVEGLRDGSWQLAGLRVEG